MEVLEQKKGRAGLGWRRELILRCRLNEEVTRSYRGWEWTSREQQVPQGEGVDVVETLIDIIPDKAALIAWLPVSQISVFEHSTAGISHSMGILAADKWLIRML